VGNQAWDGAPKTIPSLITCSRTAAAYYTTTAGVLVSFAANTLRYGNAGLLWEEARTNLVLRSDAYGTAPWSGSATVTSNALAAPDGTITADLLTQPAVNNGRQQSITGSLSTTYAASSFFFPGTGGYGLMQIGGGGAGGGDAGYALDLSSGTLTKAGAGTLTADAVHLTSSWWRLQEYFTTSAGDNTFDLLVRPQDAATAVNPVTGYSWGTQLEVGGYVTSYIPTVASTATRDADIITGLPAPTSAITDYLELGTVQGNAVLLGAGNDTILIRLSASNQVQATDGTTTITATAGAGTVGDGKVCVRRNGTSVSLCLNGGLVASGTLAVGNFGQSQYGKAANASVIGTALTKLHARWTSALSDADMQTLTDP
jgi:hypothetical protein